jgi:prepilin-type N-terminal cleavage/methylation domain-containing protein
MSTKYQAQGFSLVELLLALVIGCGLTGVLLQAMLAEGSNGQRLGRLLRERVVARRTLELVRGDLLQAQRHADPAVLPPACNLAGRTLVLHLATAAGPITYSLGKPADLARAGADALRAGLWAPWRTGQWRGPKPCSARCPYQQRWLSGRARRRRGAAAGDEAELAGWGPAAQRFAGDYDNS